jgi:hypothetical protein
MSLAGIPEALERLAMPKTKVKYLMAISLKNYEREGCASCTIWAVLAKATSICLLL